MGCIVFLMTTYFTSDLHILHRLVAGIRGFMTDPATMPDGEEMPRSSVPDVWAHNAAVVDAFSVVRPEDIIWVVGDLVANEKNWTYALQLIDTFPGRKRLICGNHDPASSIHREAWKYRQGFINEVFETVQDFAKIKMNGGTVLLSHYPYSGVGSEGLRGESQEQLPERYTEFRLTDCGTPLIHGHTHGPEKLHFSERGTPQIHVGLDAWNMKLVSQHEIEKLLDLAKTSAKVEPKES